LAVVPCPWMLLNVIVPLWASTVALAMANPNRGKSLNVYCRVASSINKVIVGDLFPSIQTHLFCENVRIFHNEILLRYELLSAIEPGVIPINLV
jgi:hypothetical protein